VANETSRIASTPLLGLIPLGSPGDRNYGRLVDIVSTRVGARHAALFAEPEPVGDGSALDWYVPGLARAIRPSALPPDQARAVRTTLDAISRDIRNYADQIDRGPRSPSNRALVEALRNALCVPGPDYVYAVAGQPVLVAWAYRFEQEPPLEVGLVRSVPLPGEPASTPAPQDHAFQERSREERVPHAAAETASDRAAPPPPRPGPGAFALATPAAVVRKPFPGSWILWPLWLMFAALVASIFWVLLRACAVNVARSAWPSITWCGGNPGAAEANQVADLQGLVDNLQEQVARRSRACPAGQLTVLQPPTPAPSPSPPTQEQIEERKQTHEAQSGALEISLAWNGPADLDLHVQCPNGQIINFRSPQACGGRLQIDMNAGGEQSNEPIEHVIFPSTGDLPPGALNIGVSWYAEKGETRDRIQATILIKRGGQTQEKRVDIPRPPAWGGDPVFYWQVPAR
jgi:hypothetical protein